MEEIGVVEVMGQLFNSRSIKTRWNRSKSWNVILMSLFTGQKREGEKEERSREEEGFVLIRTRNGAF